MEVVTNIKYTLNIVLTSRFHGLVYRGKKRNPPFFRHSAVMLLPPFRNSIPLHSLRFQEDDDDVGVRRASARDDIRERPICAAMELEDRDTRAVRTPNALTLYTLEVLPNPGQSDQNQSEDGGINDKSQDEPVGRETRRFYVLTILPGQMTPEQAYVY